MTETVVDGHVDEVDDETTSHWPMGFADIEKERARALHQYEDGKIGYWAFRAWLNRLDYKAEVRAEIKQSLDDADLVFSERPIGRAIESELEVVWHVVPRGEEVVAGTRWRGL
jgi:hypothetical protein